MKKLFYLAAVVVLLVSNAVSYEIGVSKWYDQWSKTYDDACMMSDLIRCYDDYQTDGVDECDTTWFNMCEDFLKDCNRTVELPMYVYGY